MTHLNKKYLIVLSGILLLVLIVVISGAATAVAQTEPNPPQAPQPPPDPPPLTVDDSNLIIVGEYSEASIAAGADGVVPSGFIYDSVSNLRLNDDAARTPSGTSISCSGGTGTYGACSTRNNSDYIDISATGTAVTLTNDGSEPVYLPFNFNYYGTNYSTMWINANGIFTFDGPAPDKWAGGYTLPSTYGPDNLIAAWWEDLRPDLGGTIHYQVLGAAPYRYLVVQFKDVHTSTNGVDKISFQLKMYETTSHFEITYTRVDANTTDGTSAVIGYENAAGTYGRNAFYANDDLNVPVTIVFLKPQPNGAGCYARVGGTTYGGTYWSSAIQDAVNAAAATDTILLAGDCYSNTAAGVNIDNKTLHFIGGYTTSNWSIPDHLNTPTILNGFGLHRHFLVQDTSAPPASKVVFENIYMMRGNATEGGAITINDPAEVDISQNAILVHNRATYGGAVHNSGILKLIYNAQIIENTATVWGGGIDNDGTLSHWESTVNDNTAPYGGGVFNRDAGTASLWGDSNTKLAALGGNNAATSGGAFYNAGLLNLRNWGLLQANAATYGGGIYNAPTGTLTFKDGGSDKIKNIFGNSATYGGGIYSEGTINSTCSSNCYKIFLNSATGAGSSGGGLFIASGTNTLIGVTIGLPNLPNQAENGGGIYHNAGTLTVTDSTIDDNTATTAGGGFYSSSGTLTLDNVTLTNNSADGFEDKGGAIYIDNSTININNGTQVGLSGQPNTAWFGGGIYKNNGTLNIDASTVDYNTASLNGGGIHNASSGLVTIKNSSQIRNNQADKGGGIYNLGQTNLETNANIDNNGATTSGGGIYNSGTLNGSGNTAIVNNIVSNTFAEGAGIYNYAGTVILNFTRINANTAPQSGAGAGIWNNHILEVYNSQISDNQVLGHGGGIRNDGGNATISQSSITGNTASSGGGISNVSSTAILNMTETTLANNMAWDLGGGFLNAFNAQATVTNSTFSNNGFLDNSGINSGGGIWNGHIMTVVNSTLSGNGTNASPYPNGAGGIATQGTLYLTNSIVANSPASSDCLRSGGDIIDNGPNIIEDGSCSSTVPSALTGDPALGPLAYNGGSTTPAGIIQTHALTGGSPAINNGDCNGGTLTTSQNGVARLAATPQFCDIGAYEYEATGTPFLTIGRDFRSPELQTTGTTATNIPPLNIAENFAEYDDGQLYDRYCVDFDQLQTDLANGIEADCTVWNGSNNPNGHANLDLGGTRSVNVYNTLRNSVSIQQEQAFRYAQSNPLVPTSNVAITHTLEAVREIHYIGMIYANEFYADATRYTFYQESPSIDSADIIDQEIAYLEQAYQQYNIVVNSMGLLGLRELPNGEKVADYYTESDLEMFALASTRQADVALDIAKLEHRLDPTAADKSKSAGRLETEYNIQQNNLETYVGWLTALFPDNERDNVYANNRGKEIAISMEKLARWADDIRSSNNPFGYRNEYVPRTKYASMYALTTSGEDNPLQQATDAEIAARAKNRDFEQVLFDVGEYLFNIQHDYEDQLLVLCGISDFDADCSTTTGAMAQNRAEIDAAAKQVDLSMQQIANFSQLIQNEQDRNRAVQIQILLDGDYVNLAALEIGKLNAVQELKTEFNTDQNSTREGWRLEDKVTTSVSVKVSNNPLKVEASSETTVEASLAAWHEEEKEKTNGTTNEKVTNPNLEKIGNIEGRLALRQAESTATIEGANSAAEVKRLLVAQSDAMIELDIAYAEYNAILAEHNFLVAKLADMRADYVYSLQNAEGYYWTPSARLIVDESSSDYRQRFDRLQNYAFLTAKALEYELLDPSEIPYNDLYRARRVQDIVSFLNVLQDKNLTIYYGQHPTDPDPAPNTDVLKNNSISIAKDALGLTDAYLTSLIVDDGFTVDPLATGWPSLPICQGPIINNIDDLRTCLLQEFFNNNIETIDLGGAFGEHDHIVIPFTTALEKMISPNTWNSRITTLGETTTNDRDECSSENVCTGVAVNIQTIQDYTNPSFTQPNVSLAYQGMGTYIDSYGDIVHYRPGPPRLVGQVVPNGFSTDYSANVSIFADVNGDDGGGPSGGFYLLSAVNNGWSVKIDLENTSDNGDLDFSKITDIVIDIQTVSHSVSGSPLQEVVTQMNNGVVKSRAANLALQAEYEALLAEPYVAPPLTAEEKSLVSEMVQAMKSSTITETTYIDPLVVHGQYDGMMMAMGFTEIGVIITATNETSATQPIMGTLCISCSVMHTAPTPLTGQFVNTGTPTNTFSLVSAPVQVTVDGEVLTKTYSFEGDVLERGNIISGTYEEEVTNSLGVTSSTYVGSFYLSRWSRYPGAVTPVLNIATTGNELLSWSADDANCSYEVYRTSLPYSNFVLYPRQLLETTDGTGFADPLLGFRRYRVRSFACNTTIDYLEPNATFFMDSQELALFSFSITPGN